MLDISIDRNSDHPVYQQITSQIKTMINRSNLPDGTQLPTIRALAQQLGVNRLTIQHAYRELQADGWVHSIVGSGTFVCLSHHRLQHYHTLHNALTPNNMLADLELKQHQQPVRSLASADPDLTLAPVEEIIGNLYGLRRNARHLMGHAPASGDDELRLALTQWTKDRGIITQPNRIIVTSGTIQAAFMAAFALTKPGDTVMIHEPAYVGWIHTLRSLGLNVIPIPHHANQIDFQALRQMIQQYQPVFIVPISTFSDPTGYSLPVAQKQELVTIAEEYDTLILEDDACGMLSYDQNPPPSIKSFDRSGHVIYIGSFCKTVMPGLRIGYMILPGEYHEQLLAVCRAVDATGIAFTERAFATYLKSGRLKDHIRRVNTIYVNRRDALLQALRAFMPDGVQWTEPSGGFSCWVTLPQANMMDIYRICLQMGLSFTPGDSFFIDSNPNRHFRLCFGTQSEGEIQEIVHLLAQVIYNHTDR